MLNRQSLSIPRAMATACAFLLVLLSGVAQAATASQIDKAADTVLADFRKDVKGANDLLKSAKGVLVLPDVKKAGLVVAGQYGEGVLRVGGKSAEYYKMEAASVGFQGGIQEADFIFLILTDAALTKLRAATEGFVAGVDTGITVVDSSFGGSLDTTQARSDVVAFVLGKKGLMGGWSAKGVRFTKIKP
jgi:lipid-binding SYLF domain-containing protein